MLGFFPDPYPDELFYSICARYSERVKYPYQRSSLKDIYSKVKFPVLAFPNNFDYFVSILPPGNTYSVEKLIYENTLLPFYEPFFPSDQVEWKNGSSSSAKIGKYFNEVKMREFLRFCPLCVIDDKKAYGETYWHRIHQLPGILVCSIHNCFLENSLVTWKRSVKNYFCSAEKYIRPKEPIFLESNIDHQNLLKLAKSAGWLLSQKKIEFRNRCNSLQIL